MTICEWVECEKVATHTVDIFFPEGVHETQHVCRTHDRKLKRQVVESRPKAPPPIDTSTSIEVLCGECRHTVDEPNSLVIDGRQPCPNCGSLTRSTETTFVDSLTIHEFVSQRIKQPDRSGWTRNFKSGDKYTRDLEGWGEYELETDREQNIYREVIKLYDGTRLVSRAQLTDHRD